MGTTHKCSTLGKLTTLRLTESQHIRPFGCGWSACQDFQGCIPNEGSSAGHYQPRVVNNDRTRQRMLLVGE